MTADGGRTARRNGRPAILSRAEQERYLRLLDGSQQLRAAVSEHAGRPLDQMTAQQKITALAEWREANGLTSPARFSAELDRLARSPVPKALPVTEPARDCDVTVTDLGQDRDAASTPGAERARRYRARKRGEDVPHRKPGPVATSPAALRRQVRALEHEVTILRQKLVAAETVPATASRGRQASIRRQAAELTERLRDQDPRKDRPDLRDALTMLAVALDERQDRWPR